MKSLKESNNIQSKEFGDWAIVFWKKGSKTLSIAQNQGDPGTTDFWMVGTTTRQFDYESDWLPNKKWSTAIKGHFPKDKAIQMAKEQAMKGLKESAGFVKNKNVYDFTNLDANEDTFDTIIKEFNLMELSREEIASLGLGISVQNSVVGVYGSYVSGNGTPDVVVYDFEISDRQRPYKYTINVVQMQEHARAEKYFYIISSRLSQMLDNQSKGLKEGCLDHIKDKWQSELDKGVEPKILMDPWAVCEGMKWLGKDGWIRVEEVLTPTEYEEPYPDFYMEIFDQHTCVISHDIYTINEINSYVRNTKARLVNNGIKNLVNKDIKESRINIPNKFPLSLEDLKEAYPSFEEVSDLEMCAAEAGEAIAFATVERTPKGYILMGPPGCDYVYEGSSIGELGEDMEDLIHNLDIDETWPSITNNNLSDFDENAKENKMKNLKESVGERYKIDISPIQGSGEEMLSFQEMIGEVLENMAGMDNIVEIDEEFFERKYQYYLKSHPRKMRMGPSRYEDDEAWMLAMKSTLNNDISMLDDDMIYDYYMSGRYNERSDEYKAIWDKCVHEIEKKDTDDGSRFYDRWDFTTPRVNESKKVNKKRVQESRKPFTSDIPNNLLEIQNNMEDVFEVHSLSLAASESANGLARDILTWTGTKVGELLFTPTSYYMVGPREDIYWEGSTLEEFEADVTDLSYTL